MKYIARLSLFIFVLITLLSSGTFAHSGRTDKNGGHWNRKTGTYHYHSKKTIKKHAMKKHYKKYHKKH